MSRPPGEDGAAVFGVTSTGRYVMVLVVEYQVADNDWDIGAAREMTPDEIEVFERYTDGQR